MTIDPLTAKIEQTNRPSPEVKALRAELRAVRAEMKARGIVRSSCFNGGHTPESYRLNAKVFELDTRIKNLLSTPGAGL